MASEDDFISAVTAAGRVGRWMQYAVDSKSPARQAQAIREFAAAAEHSHLVADEARTVHAAATLTPLLARVGDEAVLDALAALLAALSMAHVHGERVTAVTYTGSTRPLYIAEGRVGDGVGMRLWGLAHSFNAFLRRHSHIVCGRSILELGAGTGTSGLTAAQLGARAVYLTDYLAPVLELTARNARLNTSGASPEVLGVQVAHHYVVDDSSIRAPAALAALAHAPRGEGIAGGEPCQMVATSGAGLRRHAHAPGVSPAPPDCAFSEATTVSDEADLLDSARVASCASDDEGAAASLEGATVAAEVGGLRWDYGDVHIRHLDWQMEYELLLAASERDAWLTRQAEGILAEAESFDETTSALDALAAPKGPPVAEKSSLAPGLDATAQFDVVLGCEVMYEMTHAAYVAATLRRRLSHGGTALVAGAIRDASVFVTFERSLGLHGLTYTKEPIKPFSGVPGLGNNEDTYEEGYKLYRIEYA